MSVEGSVSDVSPPARAHQKENENDHHTGLRCGFKGTISTAGDIGIREGFRQECYRYRCCICTSVGVSDCAMRFYYNKIGREDDRRNICTGSDR